MTNALRDCAWARNGKSLEAVIVMAKVSTQQWLIGWRRSSVVRSRKSMNGRSGPARGEGNAVWNKLPFEFKVRKISFASSTYCCLEQSPTYFELVGSNDCTSWESISKQVQQIEWNLILVHRQAWQKIIQLHWYQSTICSNTWFENVDGRGACRL